MKLKIHASLRDAPEGTRLMFATEAERNPQPFPDSGSIAFAEIPPGFSVMLGALTEQDAERLTQKKPAPAPEPVPPAADAQAAPVDTTGTNAG